MAGFVGLFRMRLLTQYLSDMIFHLLADSTCLRQEVIGVPLGQDLMLRGHVGRISSVVVGTAHTPVGGNKLVFVVKFND